MSTLSEYLTAVAADADSSAAVYFDTVESFVKEDKSESTDKKYLTTAGATQPDEIKVLVLTAKVVSTAGKDATKERKAWGVELAAANTFGLANADGVNILVDSNDAAVSSITLDSNEDLAIAKIKRAAALTRATAYDLTLDVHKGYKPTGEIRIQSTRNSETAEYQLNGTKNSDTTIFSGDYVNMTIDGLTVSGTVGTTATGSTARDAIIDKLTDLWTAKYGTSGAVSYSMSLFTVSSASDKITIAAKDGSGRRGFDKSYSIKVVPATTVGASSVIHAEYGATESASDNKTISNGLIVTLESNIAGTVLNAVAGAQGIGTSVTTLTTSNQPVANVATTTTANIYPDDARGDVVNGESSVDEVATPAVSFSRIGWL